MSCHEVCKQIQEKVSQGGADHALLQPATENEDGYGRWLRMDRTLAFYDIKNNDTVEYRKKHDIIKVKLMDGSVKTVLVDLSQEAVQVVEAIGQKINLKAAEEFALQPETRMGYWLKNNLSIPEQVKNLEQTFLLKKKYFITEANVNQEDSISLHLLYCQCRDDILSGTMPCSKEEATQLASLQLQIAVGGFTPSSNRTGCKEFLPAQWQKKDIETNAINEWKKLTGMTEQNAKYRYVQVCRSLKTYGMTCFKTKEKVPGKKKLMDGLLCFTRDSIIRMEYETRRIISEHPFKHLLRWAASPETFTLDFGAYEEEYIVLVTTEGEMISNLIAGYIDIMLKRHRDTGTIQEDDEAKVAEVQSLSTVGGVSAVTTTTSNVLGKDQLYSSGVTDLTSAGQAIDRMVNDMLGRNAAAVDNKGNLSPDQRRNQIAEHSKALNNLAEALESFAKNGDRTAMNATAQKVALGVEQLISAARQAHAAGMDPDKILLGATKGVSDALKALMDAAREASAKPNDPAAREALQQAQQAVQAALQKLSAASKGVQHDDAFQTLFRELAKAVTAEAQGLLGTVDGASASVDPARRQQLAAASRALQGAADHFASISDTLTPVAKDPQCKQSLETAGQAVQSNANQLVGMAASSIQDPATQAALRNANDRLAQALRDLMGVTALPDIRGAKEAEDFTEAAQQILSSTAAMMAADGDPEQIRANVANIKNAAQKLGLPGRTIAQNADEASKARIANYLKAVVEATKTLLQAQNAYNANPNDPVAQRRLRDAAQELAEATQQLLGDAGRQVALGALYSSASYAAAATTTLYTSANMSQGKVHDPEAQKLLNDASKAASDAVSKLLQALQKVEPSSAANKRPTSFRGRPGTVSGSAPNYAEPNEQIMQAAEQFAPTAYKLVSAAKTASGRIDDQEPKKDLIFSSTNAAKAIHKMLANRKAMKAVKGQLETAEAIEAFKAAQAELESALISADTGILQRPPGKNKDDMLVELANAVQELGNSSRACANAAKAAPEELGTTMKAVAQATNKMIAAATGLAGTLDDKILQKSILNASRNAVDGLKNLMQV